MPKGIPNLIEYKNVTQNELMWLEIFGEEPKRHALQLKPDETVFLNQKDLRYHKNDKRFLAGKIVPVGSAKDMMSTNTLSDIMSDDQIHFYIKNTDDLKTLKNHLSVVKNKTTLERLLRESKKEEHNKSYNFVTMIEKKLYDIVNKEEAIYYGQTDKLKEEKENENA